MDISVQDILNALGTAASVTGQAIYNTPGVVLSDTYKTGQDLNQLLTEVLAPGVTRQASDAAMLARRTLGFNEPQYQQPDQVLLDKVTPQYAKYFGEVPTVYNQQQLDEMLTQIMHAKNMQANSQEAVAAKAGAPNAQPVANGRTATEADVVASLLARKSDPSAAVYAARGNDISFIDRLAQGTKEDPSYGRIPAANTNVAPETPQQVAERINRALLGDSATTTNPSLVNAIALANARRNQYYQNLYDQNAVQYRGQTILPPQIAQQIQQAQEIAAWRERNRSMGTSS